jgi:hypothetical protein
LLPEWDTAVTMLTNAGSVTAGDAFDELLRAVLASLGEADVPRKPSADAAFAFDATRYAGTYETYMSRIVIGTNGDQTLEATVTARNNESLGDIPDRHLVLRPIDDGRFLAEDRDHDSTSVVGFAELGAGDQARFMFMGFRLAERVES